MFNQHVLVAVYLWLTNMNYENVWTAQGNMMKTTVLRLTKKRQETIKLVNDRA